jgi:hypothetical protein
MLQKNKNYEKIYLFSKKCPLAQLGLNLQICM